MNDEAPTLPAADDGLRMLAMRLFEQALDRPSGERRPFIEAETRANAALNAAALALLDAHAASNGFLEPLPETTREIGAYRLIEPIGSGGMGRVWLAERRDGAYQQRVAIKVLASLIGDADSMRRAEAERQFLAWLDHPNIARVLDGGSTPQGQPYVVMEYVEGARIDAWCRAHQLDPAARVRLFLQVLEAIDAAHRALIIHRDIKPANVLVTADGNVKLLDFGIAKTLDGRIDGMTGTGIAPMTPEYASPEQLAAQPLTTASDIYALGLLLYELLCGASARPHGSTSASERARQAALQLPLGAVEQKNRVLQRQGLALECVVYAPQAPGRASNRWKKSCATRFASSLPARDCARPCNVTPSSKRRPVCSECHRGSGSAPW